MKSVFKYFYFLVLMSSMLTNCQQEKEPIWLSELEDGISLTLAEKRAQHISNIGYRLNFDIPEKLEHQVQAELTIKFQTDTIGSPLILDFKTEHSDLIKVSRKEESIPFLYVKEHLIIDPQFLKIGENEFTIQFIAGDMSLNRSKEYLYTLLVPDRASTLFPCFDQPNLKARYQLNLSIPKTWVLLQMGRF